MAVGSRREPVRRVCLKCGETATHVFHARRAHAETDGTWRRFWFPHDRPRFVCMRCWPGERQRLLKAGFEVQEPEPLEK